MECNNVQKYYISEGIGKYSEMVKMNYTSPIKHCNLQLHRRLLTCRGQHKGQFITGLHYDFETQNVTTIIFIIFISGCVVTIVFKREKNIYENNIFHF